MVWAEITDDDEDTENALLLTEAKVNAAYPNKGIHVSTFIVEERYGYPVPGFLFLN